MLRGKTYAEHFDAQHKITDDVVSQILPAYLDAFAWESNEVIMDHGCATGRTGSKYFVPFAEKYDSKIYAIDISRSMIDHAKEKYPHPRVEYAQTSLLDEDFPYESVKFNKIFSLFVLMSDPKYKKTLAKMHDLLAPAGTVLIAIVSKADALYDPKKHVIGHGDWKEFAEYLHLPDWHSEDKDADHVPHFRRIVEGIGFKVLDLKAVPVNFTFPSAADCAEFLLSENPHPFETQLKDEDEHHGMCNAFEASLKDLAVKLGRDDKEGYEVDYEVTILSLEKPEA